jgi:hypothetical protein
VYVGGGGLLGCLPTGAAGAANHCPLRIVRQRHSRLYLLTDTPIFLPSHLFARCLPSPPLLRQPTPHREESKAADRGSPFASSLHPSPCREMPMPEFRHLRSSSLNIPNGTTQQQQQQQQNPAMAATAAAPRFEGPRSPPSASMPKPSDPKKASSQQPRVPRCTAPRSMGSSAFSSPAY